MKIKFGILTFHRANNYGAVLQCYALQQTLIKLGYEALVIDYRQPFIELAYKAIRWDIMRQGLTKPRLLAGYLFKVLPERWKRQKKYNTFRNRRLICSKKVTQVTEIPQDIDVYLIGSDQMWGLHCTDYKVDEIYFGKFPHSKHSQVCGYAISSNLNSLQTIGHEALLSYAQNFNHLSFREKVVAEQVSSMTGVTGRVDIDPSLLLNSAEWETLIEKRIFKQNYLLTYFLHDGSDTDYFLKKQVQEFAKKRKLIVIDMFRIAVSPTDFLSAIRHAAYVITTSFHATAFSILFKKAFISLKTTDGKDIRYINLLSALDIPQRVIEISELDDFHDSPIPYETIECKLNSMRENSLAYLKKIGKHESQGQCNNPSI